MKYALVLVGMISVIALAGGEFATGGSELYKINGYNNFYLTMFGEEGANPANGFTIYNWTQWAPTLNETFSGKISFETMYGAASDYTLKLNDAYLNFNIIEELALMGGRFKVPFGYAYTRSAATNPYLYRAAVTGESDFTAFGGRDIGLCAVADFGPVVMDVAYTNGTDNNADTLVNKQFTARLQAEPADWMGLGVAMAVIGEPEIPDSSDSWSATGMDIFAHADYPLSEGATLNFEGEYMMLGFQGPEIEDVENKDATSYYASLGATFGVDMGIVTGVQPVVRYESFTPAHQLLSGAEEPEIGETFIDFALNLHTGDMNRIQIGARNFGFENDEMDGYTDMYLNWRMLF